MMKKSMSLLISFIMLISCMLPMGAFADTTAADPTLIFEMDLSNYDGKTVSTIANSAGTTSTISAGGSGIPTLNTNEAGTKYLTFRRSSNTTNVSGTSVKVVDSKIAVADALTVEAWVRAESYAMPNSASGRIFGLGNSNNHFADVMIGTAKNLYYKATGQVNTVQLGESYQTMHIGNMNVYDEQWIHYVITREWVEGTDGAGTWKIGVYVNGNEKKSTAEYAVTSRTAENDKFLVIGAHKGGTAALWGDIGTFKVYNSIKTEADALSLYENSKTLFYPVPTGEKLVFDMDLSEYSDTNKVVKNSAKFVDYTIEVSGAPVLGTTGTQKYLTFMTAAKNGDTTVDASQIKVTDSSENEEPYLINQTEQTFETWIRGTALAGSSEAYGDSRLFSITNGTRAADLYIISGTSVFRWRPNGGNTDAIARTMSSYDDKWTHVVYTRKWTVSETDSTKGTWTTEMYINGELKQEGSVSNVSKTSETNAYLTIGNSGTTQAFFGDIATFKVYNTILTEASVKSKYDASVANFVDQVTFSEFTTASGSVTATLGDSLSAKVEELDGTTIMALYAVDENGVETLIHYSEGLTLAIPSSVTLEEGMIIKCFIWNNTTDCTPLSRHYSVQCLQ